MKQSTVTFTVNHENDWELSEFWRGYRLDGGKYVGILRAPLDAEIVTTELHGPLKVGDVIDGEDYADVMDDTPPLTILSDRDGYVYQHGMSGGWFGTEDAPSPARQVIREAKPLTVVRLGR